MLRAVIIVLGLVVLLATGSATWAQDGVGGPSAQQTRQVDPGAASDSGAAYLRALRLRRIDSDVIYFDPSAPPPPLDTNARPEPADDPLQPAGQRVDVASGLIAAVVLGAILLVAIRLGGGVSLSLKSPGDAERAATLRKATGATPRGPEALGDILSMADRREAIVHLARAALASAVAAQGALFQDSWTARDALRHLPASLPHRDALQALIHAAERVQFGGRDIGDPEFDAHVDRIRPLFQSTQAAAA